MHKLNKILYTSLATGLLLMLAPVASSSANSRNNNNSISQKTEKVSHTLSNKKPVFGQLKHDYTNWTLNGKYNMWSRPANDGYRKPIINHKEAERIGRNANRREPKKYTFFLDYTATYNHHNVPDYFYASSDRLGGWVYRKGLREIGTDDPTNINAIKNKSDVYVPHAKHLTKSDYSNARELSLLLAEDMLKHQPYQYRADLRDAYWQASYLGRFSKHTRYQKRSLVKRATRKSYKIYNHAMRSKKYRKHLINIAG